VWSGFFAEHYRDVRIAEQLFANSGVRTRHTVANPVYEDVSGWGTGARMERYLAEALPLGKDAVATALADAGLAAADVGLFAVTSCTGYVTPGVDIRLARDLGMSDRVRRLFVGHMGCYAALPGLGAVADFTAARQRPSVLLCLELTSLHIQPATTDVDQVVAHALFADAAAAVVLEPVERPGFEVIDVVAQTDVSTAEYMTWDVTDLGFRMGLSPRVPAVLARHVRGVVDKLLAAHGLTVADVDGWAVHPGGRRILDVVQRRLELGPDALEHSYGVLRDHGNCSSATVLLVLERMRAAGVVEPGRHLVALAFGPGLTLYATLLRAT
jgi:predicted naringenin-chalcone synthase